MAYTLSTTKTYPYNTKDDDIWKTTKSWKCQQGMTTQIIIEVLKRVVEKLGALGWTWKYLFWAIGGIKTFRVESIGDNAKGHQ